MNKRMKVGVFATGLLLAGVAGWAMMSHGHSQPTPPVARAAAPPGVGALGRIEPASRVRKLTHPGGMATTRVDQLLVQEGDRVAAGQLVAIFADAAQKEAVVAQAEASLAEAQATLAKVKAAGRASEIAAQRARIAALGYQEEINRRDATRSDRLVVSGAGPEATAERNRFAAQRSAAERAEAQAQLETLSRPRAEDVTLYEAQSRRAEAEVIKAKADAALSRIYAPIDGTVMKIYARPGDQVGSDGLMDLADLTRLDVVADVYETDLPRLRVGAEASIQAPGDPRRYAATVREVGWLVRRTTQASNDPIAAVDARTIEVRLTLSEDAVKQLERRTNMQVQVAIQP
jgi:HlyD family secretion protein